MGVVRGIGWMPPAGVFWKEQIPQAAWLCSVLPYIYPLKAFPRWEVIVFSASFRVILHNILCFSRVLADFAIGLEQRLPPR